MLTYRRQQPTAGGHPFTFSDPTGDPTAGVEYGKWAERIKGKYGYFGKSDDRGSGAWTRRAISPKANAGDGEEEFRWLAKVDEDGDGDDSDVQSPTLWKSAGNSPARDNNNNGYSGTYPSSRSQVIAGYRQEMLDMVKDMPEAGYELSLRDMVEAPRVVKPVKEEEMVKEKKKVVVKKMARSESMDAGSFMLKMFVPRLSGLFGGRRRSSGNSGKVSPKPMVEKSKDGEWWNKEEYGEMSSSNGSSNSSTTTNRSRRKLSACASFFRNLTRESEGKSIRMKSVRIFL